MLLSRNQNRSVSILLHAGSGEPLAFRLNLRKAYLFLVVVSGIFLTLILGTLLFFRQLEVNRKLTDALLDSTVREKILAENAVSARVEPLAMKSVSAVAVSGEAIGQGTRTVASAPAVPGVKEPAVSPSAKPAAPSPVRVRVSEVTFDCASGRCNVRLVLVPTASTAIEGSLLVVLETEIPRIGTARATSNSQKRFFIYPGYQSKDELDLKEINHLEGKGFKMSRALNTNVDFQFGELLRPLAVNIFVFDSAKNLVLHERRQIDLGDS